MASLDVDSLFTNVPIDETIKICAKELLKASQAVSGFNKQQVLETCFRKLSKKFCKIKIILQTVNRLRNFFKFKDCVPETLQFNLVYKFKCESCTASNVVKLTDI